MRFDKLKKPCLHNLLYYLLLMLLPFTSCNGQNKTQPQEITSEPEKLTSGQPKLVKTQGSNEYANIHCGLQDKAGNLWFGTTGEGVYRYDGKLFIQFTIKEGLCSNTVWSMLEDKAGNIWFGTNAGVCCYDGKSITIIPISVNQSNYLYPTTSPDNTPPVKNEIWSIMQDKSGIIWFGTTEGVYCYDGKTFTRFLDNYSVINKNNLNLKMVDCILQDKNGEIWFCSGMLPGGEGLCLYDGKSLTSFKPNGDGWIRKILETKDGNLCFATRHYGACSYDRKNYINFTEKAGINNSSVSSILQDKIGNIWIATELGSGQMGEDGGVWRYDGKSFTKFTTKEGLIHNGVFCIVEDKAGNIWFGTRNTGLCRYNGKIFTSFSE